MISTDRYAEYRKTVGSFEKLTPREARRLAWATWLGDWTARQELIERSLWLVLDWTDEARVGSSSAQVDLVVEGNRSLARAAQEYRPWADGDFTAFARGRLPQAARPSQWESANRLPEVEIAFMGEAAS